MTPDILTVKTLMLKLKNANAAYREGTPVMTDQEYDDLLDELRPLVAIETFEAFRKELMDRTGKVIHDTIIGSLNKVKAEEISGSNSLGYWLEKTNNLNQTLIGMGKLDGGSIVLDYYAGKLVRATTRGDGYRGEDKTEKFQYVCGETKGHAFTGTIRAEFCLTKENFDKLCAIEPDKNHKNPRNSVVGLINDDKWNTDRMDLISVVAYQIITSTQNANRKMQLEALESFGFIVPKWFEFKYNFNSAEDSNKMLTEILLDMKENGDFWVDGLVICAHYYSGENVYYPEGMIAFKLIDDVKETTVVGFEWNVSKGGLLKPVTLLEPVELNGTTVKRASAYNASQIKEMNLAVGDRVMVHKGGEIIPVIDRISKKGPNDYILPSMCPNCQGKTEIKGVDLVCTNKSCSVRVMKQLTHFINCLEIEGAGELNLSKWGINSLGDLLSWKPNAKYSSEMNFYDGMVQKIFNNTERNLTKSLSYNGGGRRSIVKLIEFYGFRALDRMVETDTMARAFPDGIGEKTLVKIFGDWKHNREFVRNIMNDERYVGQGAFTPVVESYDGKLKGKSFCFTGTLSDKRKVFEKIVADNGGDLGSVSKNLNYLVVGENAGSKLTKAQKLGINILTESEFKEML